MGGAPSADLRGRPARVPDVPGRDADHRRHHADGGDRPDPHPPPHPRGAHGPRRRAEPPIDAGPPEPGHGTRPTLVRRRPDAPLRPSPPTPRAPAGPIGVRGHPTGAAAGSPRGSATHRYRNSRGADAASAKSEAGRRPPRGAGEVGDPAVCSTDRRPAAIEIPIPYLGGHSLHALVDAERRATAAALAARGRPSATMQVEAVDAWHVGGLFMWLQCATIYAAALYDVNPLDQPGVELGKRYTGALLGRKDMDAERTEFDGVEQGRTTRVTV